MPLEVRDVQIHHRKRSAPAVTVTDWSLDTGVHALLGPNGAGKSTLIRTLATLTEPSTGSVRVDGLEGQRIRRGLGYLPQENLPASRFTVREHLEYMCWLKQVPTADSAAEIARVLNLVSLTSEADTRISALSGGMRRRTGIASALVGSPRLVLLDEASAGLDMEQRGRLRETLERIRHTAIIVTSTHIVEDVLGTADTVTVMSRGRFVHHGPWDKFSDGGNLQAVQARYRELVEA